MSPLSAAVQVTARGDTAKVLELCNQILQEVRSLRSSHNDGLSSVDDEVNSRAGVKLTKMKLPPLTKLNEIEAPPKDAYNIKELLELVANLEEGQRHILKRLGSNDALVTEYKNLFDALCDRVQF